MIRELVEQGRLELVGGGWAQQDETLTTYKQLIENARAGKEWIRQTFPNLKEKVDVLW